MSKSVSYSTTESSAEEAAETRLNQRYEQLTTTRSAYHLRARDNSLLTLPQIFPPLSSSGNTRFAKPYNGKSASAINSLVTKLVTALLPPGQSFFRLDVDELAMKRLAMQIAQTVPDPAQAAVAIAAQTKTIQEGLAKVERTISSEIDSSNLRAKLSEALKQLIIGGNSLLYVESPKRVRVFRLDNYVVRLDPMGKLIELIVRERVHKLTLSPEVRTACDIDFTKGVEEFVHVYTGVHLEEDNTYSVEQEINDKEVPGSDGTFPEDKLPWIPLRFFSEDGEDYGRSYVDEYIGYMQSAEGLAKAIVQASAAAAKVIFMVKNGGRTSKRALASAANGAFIDGEATDVTTLQLNKAADLSVAKSMLESIDAGLAAAFMVTASIQRSGERVTAEEIRTLAMALDEQLGGIYSMLAQGFQLPFINAVIAEKTRKGTMPPLPKGLVTVTITTGVGALGRGQDADKLAKFLTMVAQLSPQAMATIRMDTLLSRLAVAEGIDITDLIKTPQELQQEQQQMQQQQMMSQAAPGVAQEIAKQGIAHGLSQRSPQGAPQ